MNDSVILFGERVKKIRILHQIGGGGFGHFAAVLHMGKYIGGADAYTVQIALLAHENMHGHERNVPLLQQRPGQITGAVSGDLNVQWGSPLFRPGRRRGKIAKYLALVYHRLLRIVS